MLILKETRKFSEWKDIKIKRKIAETRKNHATSRYRDIYSNQIERIDSDSLSVNNDSQTIRFA
jgi:hypothetical protein